MPYLLIKPNDTLFFRNGLPFGKGEETVAETNILPYPSTIWGAMFSTLLIQQKVENANTENQEKLKLKTLYLYDYKNQKILVPAPLDIFNDTNKRLHTQKFVESSDFCHSLGNKFSNLIMPFTEEKVESAKGFFIQITDLLRHYPFENNYPYITLYDTSDFLNVYDKIGIARSNETHTAEEGNLYRVEMLEYGDDWGFIVEFECEVDFPQNGILKLGGEAKTAAFEQVKKPYDLEIFEKEETINQTDLCKVYFKTPTFIPNDFLQKVTCEAAFIGNAISIGGFDVKEKRPKPMLKAIPAGSYFVLSSTFEKSIESWKKDIHEILNPLNKNGFGSFQIIPIHEFN